MKKTIPPTTGPSKSTHFTFRLTTSLDKKI